MDERRRPAGGEREVAGAWLVCLALAAACFGVLGAAAPGRPDRSAALVDPGPHLAAAVAADHRERRC